MTRTQKTTARRLSPEDTRRAARPTAARAGNQRDRMLAAFIAAGDDGRTDFELADELGMSLNSVRPRRVELRERGLIRDSGRTRKAPSGHRAHVWQAVTGVTRLPVDAAATAGTGEMVPRPATRAGCCPRCGCDEYRDVPIHGGRSIRRDCARCERFLSFPVWYGRRTPG